MSLPVALSRSASHQLRLIIKQVSWNNSNLLLKIDFQNTQRLQINKNGNYLQKQLIDQAKML